MVVTLGDEPMRQLATRLQPYLPDDTHLTSRLYSNAAALGDALAEIAASQGKLLLALDSFENIFTRASLTDRVYFLDELFDAIQRSAGEYLVFIALRTDFQSKLLEYPKWRSLLQANTFALPALTANELSEIVKAPSQKVGLTVEDALAAHVAEDATRL